MRDSQVWKALRSVAIVGEWPGKMPMKRLFLLRHAKAVPAESGIEDFDRTLMLSGMQDASAMARYLRKSDYAVDLVLCSAAARTVQTAELMLQELVCEIEYRDNLYLAEPAKIVAAVRGAPASVSALMVVGHNPGLEATAAFLAREPVRRKERARHEALEEKFPTGALAILDFDVGRWRDVVQGTGKLEDFVRPRDL
jgi:phosphohistidine phosphatase